MPPASLIYPMTTDFFTLLTEARDCAKEAAAGVKRLEEDQGELMGEIGQCRKETKRLDERVTALEAVRADTEQKIGTRVTVLETQRNERGRKWVATGSVIAALGALAAIGWIIWQLLH